MAMIKPKSEPQPAPLPKASDVEKERNARAERVMKERYADKPRPPDLKIEVGDNGQVAVANGHQDEHAGFAWRLCESVGTTHTDLAALFTGQLANGVASSPDQAPALIRQGLAFLAEVQPQNGVEGALAVQMWALHNATIDLARKSRTPGELGQIAQYASLANKAARTFAAQVEALTKLRSGGKQQVEVRYVYVDARTQTVINPPPGPGGEGGADRFGTQPHVAIPRAAALLDAPGPQVRGEDESRHGLSPARHAGKAPLPAPRRQKPRRSEGTRERKLPARGPDQ